MKKVMAILMMILVIGMTTMANADYWDDKTIEWLTENTITWCNENGYENWTDLQHFENDLILGYGIITKNDSIFYDADPRTIGDQIYITRIEELLETTIHSIDLIYYGQEGGYELYRLIIKWNDPLTTSEEFGNRPIYGEDMFIRFYN